MEDLSVSPSLYKYSFPIKNIFKNVISFRVSETINRGIEQPGGKMDGERVREKIIVYIDSLPKWLAATARSEKGHSQENGKSMLIPHIGGRGQAFQETERQKT